MGKELFNQSNVTDFSDTDRIAAGAPGIFAAKNMTWLRFKQLFAKLTGATFTGSIAAANLSGTNTGDQVGDGITITGTGTIIDPFVSVGGGGGSGDMLKATYDPTNVEADAFDYDNFTNTPTIPDAQIQSDWNQATNTELDYIKNKPSIPSIAGLEATANKDASGGYVGKTLEKINFWNTARTFMSWFVNAATAARTYTFPDKDITVAGIDDIIVYYDCTVGSGGNYANLEDAITAGKRSIKIISNITTTQAHTTYDLNLFLTAGVVLTLFESGGSTSVLSKCKIFGEGVVSGFSKSANLPKILTNRSGSGAVGAITYSTLENIDIGWGTTTSSAPCVQYCILNKCALSMYNSGGRYIIGSNTIVTNSLLIGGGSNSYGVMIGANIVFYNLYVFGTYSGASPAFQGSNNSTFVNNMIISATNFVIYNGNYRGVNGTGYTVSRGIFFESSVILKDGISALLECYKCTITGDTIFTNVIDTGPFYFEKCTIAGAVVVSYATKFVMISCDLASTLSIYNNNFLINKCNIVGATILNGDYGEFTQNENTGLLTLMSGSEYNDISHNTLTGGLTDSSASTTNIIKDYI